MGHIAYPCPFKGWFVIYRLALVMINLCTKLGVSTFTHYEDSKDKWLCYGTHTHTQTHRHTTTANTALSIASRGKNAKLG